MNTLEDVNEIITNSKASHKYKSAVPRVAFTLICVGFKEIMIAYSTAS